MIGCSFIQRQNKCRLYSKFTAFELRQERRADLHTASDRVKYLYRSSNEWKSRRHIPLISVEVKIISTSARWAVSPAGQPHCTTIMTL
ncbi:unnamed protein product [Clonostachys solani]|uniref:Uncharacterized protein n=1 Tax=Clonostachys solani TaxID=160281 RepID=A0A9N9YP66_9HYPO|nr:unnamed protein product [Clonostachys solani]